MVREWTDEDLDRLRRLDQQGHTPAEIARALGRDQKDVEEHLAIVRARKH